MNERIAHRGYELIDEYINNSTTRRFRCSEGHTWETAPANVLSGTGCHFCCDRTSDYDVFYVWLAGPQDLVELKDGEFLLKYGISSERRGDLRIKEVAWAWNTKPNVLKIVKTKDKAVHAERLASEFGQKLSSNYSFLDGWTEFRIVRESEVSEIITIAEESAEYNVVGPQK